MFRSAGKNMFPTEDLTAETAETAAVSYLKWTRA